MSLPCSEQCVRFANKQDLAEILIKGVGSENQNGLFLADAGKVKKIRVLEKVERSISIGRLGVIGIENCQTIAVHQRFEARTVAHEELRVNRNGFHWRQSNTSFRRWARNFTISDRSTLDSPCESGILSLTHQHPNPAMRHILEELYDEHASALFAFLLNMTRSEPETRDLLQEVFLKLAKDPQLMDGVANPRGFLLKVSHNLVLDSARRRGTRQKNYDQLAVEMSGIFAPSGDPDEVEFRRTLAEALVELPGDQRFVVHLKLWEGMTFDEISKALSESPNTVASRYRYGLDKLRSRLRPLYDEIN